MKTLLELADILEEIANNCEEWGGCCECGEDVVGVPSDIIGEAVLALRRAHKTVTRLSKESDKFESATKYSGVGTQVQARRFS